MNNLKHEWFIGGYQDETPIFPFSLIAVVRNPLEKSEIDVGCSSMGMVIDFFIVVMLVRSTTTRTSH
jgi:hypothetical protein